MFYTNKNSSLIKLFIKFIGFIEIVFLFSPFTVEAGFWAYSPTVVVSTVTTTVGTTATVQDDGDDIRFAIGNTPLSYWLESWVTNGISTCWVKCPSLVVGTTTIYLYYNDTTAVSASSGSTTFLFFDDFESGVGKWTILSGTWEIVSATQMNGKVGNVYKGNSGQVVVSTADTWTNFILELEYRANVDALGYSPYPLIRYTNGNFYRMGLENYYGKNFYYNAVVGGGLNQEIRNLNVGWAVGTWYKQKVIMNGANIYGELRNSVGALVSSISTINSAITSGRLSLVVENPTNAEFNNIRLRKYASSEPTVSIGAEEDNPGVIYPTFLKRRPVYINSTLALTDYQVKVNFQVKTIGILVIAD